eukprot:TRINITY_DN161_c1_g1_i9.p1 TRINITY_DN161_c1_g1~~TRINITY_DN161_c1_g1_i9.p1  ORF type:complete len:229 (+),score=-19.47 TRINITY_DN161_c1_g1_i9:84-770(+)
MGRIKLHNDIKRQVLHISGLQVKSLSLHNIITLLFRLMLLLITIQQFKIKICNFFKYKLYYFQPFFWSRFFQSIAQFCQSQLIWQNFAKFFDKTQSILKTAMLQQPTKHEIFSKIQSEYKIYQWSLLNLVDQEFQNIYHLNVTKQYHMFFLFLIQLLNMTTVNTIIEQIKTDFRIKNERGCIQNFNMNISIQNFNMRINSYQVIQYKYSKFQYEDQQLLSDINSYQVI